MKRTSNLVWLLIVFIISACSAPAPSTKEVPTPTPIATQTAAPQPTEFVPPHSSPEPSQAATPFQPATFSSSLDPNQVSVDVSITYQTIDGFGATHGSLEYQGMSNTLSPLLTLAQPLGTKK